MALTSAEADSVLRDIHKLYLAGEMTKSEWETAVGAVNAEREPMTEKSALETRIEKQVEDATGMNADEVFRLADLLLEAMEANPGETWTPSSIGRKVRAETHKVGPVLSWMVDQHYIACDERGAWTHYFAR